MVPSLPTNPRLLRRGIYKAPYLKDGYEVLVAIKANHDWLQDLVLKPGITEDRGVRWLQQKLNRLDPPAPQLFLVPAVPAASSAALPARTAPPVPRQLTVEAIDELYRDANPVARHLWFRKRKRFLERSRPATTLRLG